jgi:NADH dehydrogenase FAD-containing subunit
MTARPRVAIVGGGFAGLETAGMSAALASGPDTATDESLPRGPG